MMVIWIELAASGVFSGLASILLRMAALKGAVATVAWLPFFLRGAAVGSYGLGFMLYAVALRKVNLGIAYPLIVATSILVVLAFTAVHEHALKLNQAFGAAVVLFGIWLVTRQT